MPTKIEWADESWNPLRAKRIEGGKVGWQCVKIAPECRNCYAEAQNVKSGSNPARMGTGVPYAADKLDLVQHVVDTKTLAMPLTMKKSKRIFPCSMTDLFGEWVPNAVIDRIYAVMALCPQHTFIVLTKRPARRRDYLKELQEQDNLGQRITAAAVEISHNFNALTDTPWPLPNVIEMGSVGTQQGLDLVAPILADTPAVRIGLSLEPLLEPVTMPPRILADEEATLVSPRARRLDWLICGGESGEHARAFDVSWARKVLRQCLDARIPFFMKQMGRHVFEGSRRIKLNDIKGGDYSEFPESLRWRQEPACR